MISYLSVFSETHFILRDNQFFSCKSEHFKIPTQSCSDKENDASDIPLDNSGLNRINQCNNSLINEPIEKFIFSDLDIIVEPKEILSDNTIANKMFNSDAHIVKNTDDSNGNRNDDNKGNITLSNCFRPINIDETFTIEATSNTSTNNNENLDSKMNDVDNSILQFKDLIDQAQKLLHNFQNEVNVTLNPEPTVFNLDVANCLNNQDNSQNHSWKKGTTLIIGDSILSSLRECKMPKQKTIKIRTFPGATIGDMKFFIIPHLRKSPDKIVLHVGTNDAPHATPEEMFNAIEDLKSFIQKYAPESKIIISTPVLRVDKANANDINRRYIGLLKEAKVDCIFNNNIAESNIDQYGLHINESGSVILAKILI